MRGCLQKVKRKPGQKRRLGQKDDAWNIVLYLGRIDGKTKYRCIRFHGTRKQAEERRTELVCEVHRDEFVEPSKLTVGEYLDEWLKTAVQPRRAKNTYDLYANTIKKHFKKAFGTIPLRKLSVLHVERYYAESTLAPATLAVHHAILSTALKAAVTKRILRTNVASLASNKPSVTTGGGDVLDNVWSADEARQFLTKVKADGSEQDAALFALLVDSGVRKGELLGLQWRDLEGNKLLVERQLLRGGLQEPTFIPPKRGGVRTIDLSDETVTLLQRHKRKQAELKMANRMHYHDYGLMFAQTWEHIQSKSSMLGAPLYESAVNKRLTALCIAAGVKEITPHGLRHTCATLLLSAGVPAHVVQRRLGHKKIEMTLNIYSHVLPSMQQDAATRLASLLHG